MTSTGSSPVARALARAATGRDVSRLLEHPDITRYGWKVSYDGDIQVRVELTARFAADSRSGDNYVLSLHCDSYDSWPPEAKFVNPETGKYQIGTDEVHLPLITGFPNFGIHARFNGFFDRSRVDQLICFSLTRGYYDSNHVPEPQQRWTPGRHWLYSTIKVLHRALQPPYYQGRTAT